MQEAAVQSVQEYENGCLEILNIGYGDIKMEFDSDESKYKIKRAISDMMKMGYSIFVELSDGSLRRVDGFDPDHMEYILKGPKRSNKKKSKDRKSKDKRVPASRVKATAVGRSAGG